MYWLLRCVYQKITIAPSLLKELRECNNKVVCVLSPDKADYSGPELLLDENKFRWELNGNQKKKNNICFLLGFCFYCKQKHLLLFIYF